MADEGWYELSARQTKINDLMNVFQDFVEANREANRFYRGIDNENYPHVAKVYRDVSRGKKYADDYDWQEAERAIFNLFKRNSHPLLPAGIENDWELYGIAQHFGLPTRLLDWSHSPLVAAWFAAQTSSSAGPNEEDKNGLITVVKVPQELVLTDDEYSSKNPINYNPGRLRFFFPKHTVQRIINQRGLFSYHPRPPERDQNDKQKDYFPELESNVYKFCVPACLKLEFKKRLFKFGVDASFIKGGLDGTCETLDWQYYTDMAVGDFIGR